jgi:hypothetical protein
MLPSIIVGLILAQSQPETKPAPPAPLAGHKVEQPQAPRPTIVERDFGGNIRRPEPTAVEAALAKLTLDDASRAKVDHILADRARILEAFVEKNLDLLTRFGAAENSSDGRDKFFLAVEAFQKLEPLRANGPLDQQVRDALPPDQAKEYNRLLREYWNALAEEDSHTPKPKGRVGIIIDEKLKDLGREIEAAFHRAERSGAVLYGYLFTGMTLSPEQSKRLHELCASYSAMGVDTADKKLQGTFFLAVTQVLEPDQRKAFVKRIKGK